MSGARTASNSRFAHLHVRSGYSYGQGVAHPAELVAAASGMGYERLALTDRDGVYGLPRFIAACSEHGVAPIAGAEVSVEAFGERGHVVMLCESAAGYAALSSLITGYRLSPRSEGAEPTASERRMAACPLELLLERASTAGGLVCLSGAIPYGLLASLVEKRNWSAAKELLGQLREAFGPDNIFVELTDDRTRNSRRRLHQVYGLAAECGVKTAATNEVSYIYPEDHRLSEVMWAAYSGTSLPEPGHRPTDALYLKDPEKMERTFAGLPEALQNTARMAERCAGALGKTPEEFAAVISGAGYRRGAFAPAYRSYSNAHRGSEPGSGPEDRRRELLQLVLAGARKRYRGRGDISYGEVLARLRRELSCIGALGYTSYFLLAAQARQIAVSKGTPVTGRGSAANSLVCHVLGLTQPDPCEQGNLLFERFMHTGRSDAPDIDIDLDSDLRDQVLGDLIARYADTGAAVASTAQEFSLKGAVRAAGKALGYRPSEIDALAKGVPSSIRDWGKGRDAVGNEQAGSIWDQALAEPSMRGSVLQDRRRYSLLMNLSERLVGRLHQAGTHLGGLVVGTDHRHLRQIVPMEAAAKPGLSRIQWDKDDLDLLQIPKLDLLGLKMHTALRKAGELVTKRVGEEVDPLSPPANDRAAYRLIASGQTAGAFNLESPGQSELSRRLRPKRLEHIQAQISLFRPGPLRGSMVEPYVARKNGLEAYSVPLPELEDVLKETYGVLVYQESVLALSRRVAGYTLAEADQIRRAMTKDRGPDAMTEIREDFLQRTISRGTPAEKAVEVFELVENFAAYGFSAAHAASFAKIAYGSAYMLAHYPAEFIGGGLLNSQPMGYYSPRVLVEEARRKGIAILEPDIHLSGEGFTVEQDGSAIRPGLSYCKGLSGRALEEILLAREEEPFCSPADLYRRTSIGRDALTNLIEGGFLDGLSSGTGGSVGAVRRDLLEAAVSLPVKQAKRSQPELPSPALTQTALPETASAHPASFFEFRRPEVRAVRSLPFPPAEALRRQRRVLGVDVGGHPLAPYRGFLWELGVTPADDLRKLEGGTRARAAGIMESLQRPPAKPGGRPVNFLLVEDETGLLQCTLFAEAFSSYGHLIYRAGAFLLEGKVEQDQRRGFSFVVETIEDLGERLDGYAQRTPSGDTRRPKSISRTRQRSSRRQAG